MEKVIKNQFLTGERALFGTKDAEIYDTIFTDGESPLKESSNIGVYGSMFKWKYPLWYCRNISVRDSAWFDMARAGVWYTDNISVEDCVIEAPKNFRRCDGVTLRNVSMSNAAETLWNCKNIKLDRVVAKGDYFAMNCENAEIDGLTLYGNYSFDGVKNMTVKIPSCFPRTLSGTATMLRFMTRSFPANTSAGTPRISPLSTARSRAFRECAT